MDQKELAEVGVLGTLQDDDPATLEGIHSRLRDNFRRYWGYGYGVLSPARDRLLEVGHIEPAATGDERYVITTSGVDRLRDLLRSPLEEGTVIDIDQRHRLVIRVGFLHHLPPGDQADVLAEMEDRLREERESWLQRFSAADGDADTRGYRADMADLIVRIIDSHLEWIEGVSPPTAVD